jgi:hypothetical protein
MSADLVLRYGSDPTTGTGDLDVRFENTTNAPVTSITWRANGQAVAGTYTLLFTKSGSVTCDVEATGDGATDRNPWGDRSGLTVTADGSTENLDLIPGLGIVVSASVDTGWAAKVTIGNYLNVSAVETEVLEFEIVVADADSSNRQVACRNVGTQVAATTTIYSLPGWYYDGSGAEEYIERLVPHSSPSRHKLASKGSFVITFTDRKLDGGTGKYTVDVLVDGNKAVEDAQMDGTTQYEYGVTGYDDTNDYLTGMGIILPDTTADPTSSSITVYVRDGYTWVAFAPDVSGSPGTWQTAGDDLVLGDIAASDHELFWLRCEVPSAAAPESTCRMAQLRARGLSI